MVWFDLQQLRSTSVATIINIKEIAVCVESVSCTTELGWSPFKFTPSWRRKIFSLYRSVPSENEVSLTLANIEALNILHCSFEVY